MKFRYFIAVVLGALFTLAGCQKEQEYPTLNNISLSESYVSLPAAGGTTEITVTANGDWSFEEFPRWVTVNPSSGSAGETKVTFSVLETKKQRAGEGSIKCGDETQYLRFIQYYKEDSGPHEFVKVGEVTSGRAYLIVINNGGSYLAMTPNTDASSTYAYNKTRNVSANLSSDGNTITLNDQDNSFIFRTSGAGYSIQQMADTRYIGNEAGYRTVSVGGADVIGGVWTVEFGSNNTAKIYNGTSYLYYDPSYSTVGVYAEGDVESYLYEDTQTPSLDELMWTDPKVSKLTKTSALATASYVYNGIEPLDDAGFILSQGSKDTKISTGVKEDGTIEYEFTDLEQDTEYTVVAYLDYEGEVHESSEVTFQTKGDVPVVISIETLLAGMKEIEDVPSAGASLADLGDFAAGVVTAVNGEGQNLYNGLVLEDGTGKANSGVYLYGSAYNNAYAVGDSVRLNLADAVFKVYNNLYEITSGTLEKVGVSTSYKRAEVSAADLADYVGMYVTIKNVKSTAEKGTVWNDGAANNANVAFADADGNNAFAVRTNKSAPWAKELVGVGKTGKLNAMVQIYRNDIQVFPISAADVEEFKNTDPAISAVNPGSLSWNGSETVAKTIAVTGVNGLRNVAVSVDNDHFTASASGLNVTVTPVSANATAEDITGTLTILAIDGNKVEVELTHKADKAEPFETLEVTFPITGAPNVSSYADTWTAKTGGYEFSFANFNNNNGSWSYIKCGRRADPSVASVANVTAFPNAVSEIILTMSSILSLDKVNSISLSVYSDSDLTAKVCDVAYTGELTTSNCELTFEIPSDKQAANLYYVVTFDCASHGSKNGIITLDKIIYNK